MFEACCCQNSDSQTDLNSLSSVFSIVDACCSDQEKISLVRNTFVADVIVTAISAVVDFELIIMLLMCRPFNCFHLVMVLILKVFTYLDDTVVYLIICDI